MFTARDIIRGAAARAAAPRAAEERSQTINDEESEESSEGMLVVFRGPRVSESRA